MKTDRPTSFEDDLRALDLAVHVDLHAARRAARGGSLGRGETSLMKAVLVQALYPRVAAPDPNNSSRERESDWRFHARGVRDAVLHPTSTLNAPDHAPAPTEDRRLNARSASSCVESSLALGVYSIVVSSD